MKTLLPSSAPTPRRLRLLIVDDISHVRRNLSQLLSLTGDLQIAGEAADGVEALRLAALLQPDVILLDLEMPGMDGYTAAGQIKERWPDCRVIALSVHSYPAARQKAAQSGCDDFLEKGASLQEILKRITGV
jgi:DNA-binding NarL/FixJ family response regulator